MNLFPKLHFSTSPCQFQNKTKQKKKHFKLPLFFLSHYPGKTTITTLYKKRKREQNKKTLPQKGRKERKKEELNGSFHRDQKLLSIAGNFHVYR